MRRWRLPWWREVRRADIPPELRERFEVYGETVLSLMLSGPALNQYTQGVELMGLIQQKRAEIISWLRERRDEAELREQRLETLEWAILIFVGMEVLYDVVHIFKAF